MIQFAVYIWICPVSAVRRHCPSMPAGCRKWRIGCKRPLTVLSVKRLHSPWSATRWAVRLSAKYWRANLAEWPVWHAGRHVAEHVVAQPNPKLTHSLPQEQVFDFITMGVNQSFDAWRRYQRFILPGVALCDRAACERLDQRYWLADNPEEMLGTYAGPVLIVTGKQDQIVGYEDQQALLPHYPNATFVTLDNAGHNAHIDQPEAVITLVREWVAHMAFAPLS